MIKYLRGSSRVSAILLVLTLLASTLAFIPRAFAATGMSHVIVMETNMNATGTSQVNVAFTAGASDIAGTVTVNFGAWGGTVNATQTINTGTCQALTGATNVLPGTLTAAGSGNIVTVSSVTALTAGQSYCFTLTSATAVTNPAAGVYPVVVTDATDSGTPEIAVISNDQIAVTATVPATLTYTLSPNTDAFTTNLSSSTLTITSGVTATISTNANSGYDIWAEDADASAGLTSASQSKTIPSVATGSNVTMNGAKLGTESYALGVTTANAMPNYADSGGITGGGLSTSVFTEIASGSVPVSGATTTIKELADIAATTPAASDYKGTITISAAGNY